VEGRQILDNIIQAQEVVQSLTRKKKAGMIVQLDTFKAYEKGKLGIHKENDNFNWI